MKNIFRASVFGLVMTAFIALTAVSGWAQDACSDAVEVQQVSYNKFKEKRKTPWTVENVKISIQSGEEFLSKYGTCPDNAKVADYIREKLPELKTYVARQELFGGFNEAIKDAKNVNPDKAFAGGKQIISVEGADTTTALDVSLVLASVGYDNAVKATPDYKYNNDTINYAKSAIQMLEGGKVTTETFGYYSYIYAIKDPTGKVVDQIKSKANALAWMNYTIGTIMYYGQKNQKDALPYFYKAAQYDAPIKKRPGLYQAFGAWYLAELLKMDEQRLAKIQTNANKDNEETLAMFALEKGYADRAIDAYARAYNLANADARQTAEYKKGLYEKLQALYKIRFDSENGIKEYVSTVMTKPMPDPMTPVAPVVEVPKATTTTTSSTVTVPVATPTTTKPGTTTTTKPSTTTTTKPVTDSTTTTKPTTDSTTTKPTSQADTKPATGGKTTTTKKKGTR